MVNCLKAFLKRAFLIVISISVVSFMFISCSVFNEGEESGTSKSVFALDTMIHITIYHVNGDLNKNNLIDESFKIVNELENLLSKTVDTSDVSKINSAKGMETKISKHTYNVLELCNNISEATGGAFDATLGGVSGLWDFMGEKKIPEENEIKAELSHVDYKNMVLRQRDNEYYVTLKDTKAKIDLGGVAKGYVADIVYDYLVKNKVKSGIIDLGGNIFVIGGKGKNFDEDFTIGIQNPEDSGAGAIAKVPGQDITVVTSGVYQRNFSINDVLYHHILDPKTGMPVHNGLASVSIICDNSALADALSTACFVLGEVEGLELIEKSFDNVEALFIKEGGAMSMTKGLKLQ